MPPRRPRPTSPLLDALHLLHAATHVVTHLKRQPHYLPDDEDFTLLQQLYDEAQHFRIAVTRMEWHMRKRRSGEPESPSPWDRDNG